MNYQKQPSDIVLALLDKCDMPGDGLAYYAWPQAFPNTTGPRGGIGGQAMSSFTVEAWVNDSGGALLLCAGMWSEESNFSPFMKATKWYEIPKDLMTKEPT